MPIPGAPPDEPDVPVPPATPNLVGLALSGGGIRSATFALGALQALNEKMLLRLFDYLSTVSGGGFTGGWWSAWLARGPRGEMFPRPEDIEPSRRPPTLLGAGQELQGAGAAQVLGVPGGGPPAPDPVYFLRLFANYLTPRRGVLSSDTWRAITFYVRSLLFTWLVLLPLFLAAVVVGQLYFVASDGDAGRGFVCSAPDKPETPAPAAPVAAAAPAAMGARVVIAAPSSPLCSGFATRHTAVLSGRLHLAALPFVFLLTAMGAISLLWLLHGTVTPLVSLLALVLESGFVIWLAATLFASGTSGNQVALLAGAGAGLVIVAHLVDLLRVDLVDGAIQHDVFRTRLAQWHTLALFVSVALALWLLLAGFGHEVVWWLFFPESGAAWSAVRRAGGWGGVGAAVASAAWTAFKSAPSPRAKDSAEPESAVTRVALQVAPYVVLTVLALLLATAGQALIARLSMPAMLPVLSAGLLVGAFTQILFALWDRSLATPRWLRVIATLAVGAVLLSVRTPQPARASVVMAGAFAAFAALMYWDVKSEAGSRTFTLALPGLAILGVLSAQGVAWSAFAFSEPSRLLHHVTFAIVLLLIALVIGVGWTSDPNMLSMHAFYKARLVRAYLGASNPARWRDRVPVTGGAPGDDVQLTDLWNVTEGAPYHLVNTTLNLVASRDLAVAQRMSADFVMSKYYCGSARTGYRRTDEYMDGQLTLGTAVAVSGAAASPNMGARTPSLPLILLLALVNARLGFWAPSPGRGQWKESRATLWPYYLLKETLSQTTDVSSYCYLSDGGHFDNTGLYALVERGCRFIVMVDCGADPAPCFEDVGTAIRRCRIDFGTEFSFDVEKLLERTAGASLQETDDDALSIRMGRVLATRQVLAGRIQYRRDHWEQLGLGSVPDEERLGVILWIKPNVVRADAVDVRQYNLQNRVFPQQTTMDQWYDEAQFESYRKLAYDTVLNAMAREADQNLIPPPFPLVPELIEGFFEALWRRHR